MEKQKQLTEYILEQGINRVGYSQLSELLPTKYRHLKSGITVALRLADEVVSEIDVKNGPTPTYFHHYRTANALIDQVTFKISSRLQEWGYSALPIAASQSINIEGWNYRGLFPHRTGAVMSGLGWIGRNCCLVTEEFGPRVRLGTVLTNMEFQYGTPILKSQCGDCKACVEACPAAALTGKEWVPGDPREDLFDPELCSNHMKRQYQKIGRGAVCGICVKVCSKGTHILKR